jgi:hypothetical protein
MPTVAACRLEKNNRLGLPERWKMYICWYNLFAMKKFLLSLMLPAAIVMTSCGGDEEKAEGGDGGEKVEATDFSGMESVDLASMQLKAKVMVPQIAGPNGDIIPPVVKHEEDDFFWTIEIGEGGEKFRLIIENAEGLGEDLVAEKKQMFEDFWEIEYLLDEKDVIMYQKKVKNDGSVPEQFHVFGMVTIDGVKYKVYSDETIQFRKPEAEEMLRTIRSMLEAGAEA